MVTAALKEGFAALGIPLTEAQLAALHTYADLLLEGNRHQNLTAITAPEDVARLHFLDSAALLSLVPAEQNTSLLDLGTGAGFPGLVLKILRPDLELTLLDSQRKRLLWLETVCQALGITDVRLLHGRGETLAHDITLRESFGLVTARAVAALPLLAELCLPFVRVGGAFLAMKGPQARQEAEAAAPALHMLGGGTPRLLPYTLPPVGEGRCLVMVSKLTTTEARFPRSWARMQRDAI